MQRYGLQHTDPYTRYDISEQFIHNLNRERERRGENPYRYRVPAMIDQSSARKSLVVSLIGGLGLLTIGYFSLKLVSHYSKPKKTGWF